MTLPTLGIDLAKDKFDVALHPNGRSTHKVFPNTAEGITALLDWLQAQGHPPCMRAWKPRAPSAMTWR